MPLPHGDPGTVKERKGRGKERDRLRERSPQKSRPEGVPCESEDGEDAGIHDGDRVQQRRDGRRRAGSGRQPAVEREDRGLGAETEKAEMDKITGQMPGLSGGFGF